MDGDAEVLRAVCWEMRTRAPGPVEGFRAAVVDRYVLTQLLQEGSGRPRWTVEDCGSDDVAAARAVAATRYVEEEFGGVLVAEPASVSVHPSELRELAAGTRIPPSLRARMFTRLSRDRAAGNGAGR
jgi:hypothetical protein